mmetsp:Transcript_22881/g.54143  ORF Transcript_22881/g.54143 Transcript_22881/m.54143 type:complete len:396 (+) Transcript_22881:304-1491(+)
MSGSHVRGYQNQNVHHERNFVNPKDEYGTMHKGCWYPPQNNHEPPAQFPNQPFANVAPQGPFLVPAFPGPFGMPQGMMPPNGQGGNQQIQVVQLDHHQVMQMMMMQGLPPGVTLPPNFDPTNMPMPPGMIKIQPGMPGMMPPMEPGMTAVPFPLPPNALGQPGSGNYIAGTFTEDQIPHQTVPTEGTEKKVEYFNSQQQQQDMLPEALRNLSISPSDSELSCNSTSAYRSESPAGSDTDHGSPLTGSSMAPAPVEPVADAEEQANYPAEENYQTEIQQQPQQQPQQHYQPVQRERGPRPYVHRKPHPAQDQGERSGPGYNNRNAAMRSAGRMGYQGGPGPRGPANRGRMGPNAYARGSPRTGAKGEEDGEWQTVERSGPKHRTGPRPPGPRPSAR